jgi:hypothetical protein
MGWDKPTLVQQANRFSGENSDEVLNSKLCSKVENPEFKL